jgi:hypothetical protein
MRSRRSGRARCLRTLVYDSHGVLKHFWEGRATFETMKHDVDVLSAAGSTNQEADHHACAVSNTWSHAVAFSAPRRRGWPPARRSPADAARDQIPGSDGGHENEERRRQDGLIADVRGKKGTLVVFMRNACPWAKAWETRIVEIGNAAAKQGVGMIAINSNDPDVRLKTASTRDEEAREGSRHSISVRGGRLFELARAFGATRLRKRSCSTPRASWSTTERSTTTRASPRRFSRAI